MSLRLPLQTARLTLRGFQSNDFDAIHAYASDAEVTRYMFYGPRTVEDTRAYLERTLAGQQDEPRMTWELAVTRAGDGRLVGACDLTLESQDEADLGFILARDVWGLGYATEAARAMVRAGFEQIGVRRIFSTCDVANVASARVLEKAGPACGEKTILENHKFAKDRWWSSFLYGVSLEEWTTVQRGSPAGD